MNFMFSLTKRVYAQSQRNQKLIESVTAGDRRDVH
jgi:preprotein translocase subunit YajC